jgi:hypothetical protein
MPTLRETDTVICPVAAVAAPRHSQRPAIPPSAMLPICAIDDVLN